MSYDVKQVIVMRYKYPDGKGGTMSLRMGKVAAQVAHASMSFITKRMYNPHEPQKNLWHLEVDPVELEWLKGSFAKIVLRVDTGEELQAVYDKAVAAGLETHMITDSGATEFHGIPTNTCVAIGPDFADKLKPITGDLKLL